MTPPVPPSRTSIGATLRDARRRYGLEVREVEERTKIRARYIRALENEDWETLPAPAYVRGFLRTYGQLLGLDGEMLADEFRRTYGEEPAASSAPAEPVLRERRRPGDRRPPSRGLIIVGVIVAIVALIFVLGLLSGDDPAPDEGGGKAAKATKQKDGGGKGGAGDKQPKPEPVDATLVAKTAVEVCLVGDDKEALIDGQQLQEGAREEYEGYKTYRLDIGPGDVRFTVGGDSEKLSTTEDATYEADSTGIRQIEPAGPECP